MPSAVRFNPRAPDQAAGGPRFDLADRRPAQDLDGSGNSGDPLRLRRSAIKTYLHDEKGSDMRIELSTRNGYQNVASCNGIERVSTGSALCKLARAMVDSGIAPETPVEVFRAGTPVFAAKPVRFWAERSVTEGATEARLQKWSPFPASRP